MLKFIFITLLAAQQGKQGPSAQQLCEQIKELEIVKILMNGSACKFESSASYNKENNECFGYAKCKTQFEEKNIDYLVEKMTCEGKDNACGEVSKDCQKNYRQEMTDACKNPKTHTKKCIYHPGKSDGVLAGDDQDITEEYCKVPLKPQGPGTQQ